MTTKEKKKSLRALIEASKKLVKDDDWENIQINIVAMIKLLEESPDLFNPVGFNIFKSFNDVQECDQHKFIGLFIYLRYTSSQFKSIQDGLWNHAHMCAKVQDLIKDEETIKYYLYVLKQNTTSTQSFYQPYLPVPHNGAKYMYERNLSFTQKLKLSIIDLIAYQKVQQSPNFTCLKVLLQRSNKSNLEEIMKFVQDPIWKIILETGALSSIHLVKVGQALFTNIQYHLPDSVMEAMIECFFQPFLKGIPDNTIVKEMLSALNSNERMKFQDKREEMFFFVLKMSGEITGDAHIRRQGWDHRMLNVTIQHLSSYSGMQQMEEIINKIYQSKCTVIEDFHFLIDKIVTAKNYHLQPKLLQMIHFEELGLPIQVVIEYILEFIAHQKLDVKHIVFFYERVIVNLDIHLEHIPLFIRSLLRLPVSLHGKKADTLSLNAWFQLITNLRAFSAKISKLIAVEGLEPSIDCLPNSQEIVASIRTFFQSTIEQAHLTSLNRDFLSKLHIATTKLQFNWLCVLFLEQFNNLLFMELNANSMDQTVSEREMDRIIQTYCPGFHLQLTAEQVCYFDVVLCNIVTTIMKVMLEKNATILLTQLSFKVLKIYELFGFLKYYQNNQHMIYLYNSTKSNCDCIQSTLIEIIQDLPNQSKHMADRLKINRTAINKLIHQFKIEFNPSTLMNLNEAFRQFDINYAAVIEEYIQVSKLIEFLSEEPIQTSFVNTMLHIDLKQEQVTELRAKITTTKANIRKAVPIKKAENERMFFFFGGHRSQLFKFIAFHRRQTAKETVSASIEYAVEETARMMFSFIDNCFGIPFKDLCTSTIASIIESNCLESEILVIKEFITNFRGHLRTDEVGAIKEKIETTLICAQQLIKTREKVFPSLSKFSTINQATTATLLSLLNNMNVPVFQLLTDIEKEIGGLSLAQFEYFAKLADCHEIFAFISYFGFTSEEKFQEDLEHAKYYSSSWKNERGLYILDNLEMVYHLIQPVLPSKGGSSKSLRETCEQVRIQLDKCGKSLSLEKKLNSFHVVIEGQCSLITFFSAFATLEHLDFFAGQAKTLLECGFFVSRTARHAQGAALLFFKMNSITSQQEEIDNFPEIINALQVFTGSEGSEYIKILVQIYPRVKAIHALRLQMEELAHPNSIASANTITLKDKDIKYFDEYISMLKQEKQNWETLLQETYSTETGKGFHFLNRAQLLAPLMLTHFSFKQSIFSYLWCCFPDYDLSVHHVQQLISEALHSFLRTYSLPDDGNAATDREYIGIIGKLLEMLAGKIASAKTDRRVLQTIGEKPARIVIDSTSRAAGDLGLATMKNIFSTCGYVPSLSQLLDCGNRNTNEQTLMQFLGRAEVFVDVPFYLLQVDELPYYLQERLINFLNSKLSKGTGRTFSNLSLFFTSYSSAEEYDRVSYAPPIFPRELKIPIPPNYQSIHYLKANSRTGKTFKIENTIEKIPHSKVITFYLCEDFTPGKFIEKLTREKISEFHDPLAPIIIHMDISAYCYHPQITSFLYSLLCFGVLFDDSTGKMYHLPTSTYFRFYFELHRVQVNTARSNPNSPRTLSTEELLRIYWLLPIVGTDASSPWDHKFKPEDATIVFTWWKLFCNAKISNMAKLSDQLGIIEIAMKSKIHYDEVLQLYYKMRVYLKAERGISLNMMPKYKNLFVFYLVQRCHWLLEYIRMLVQQTLPERPKFTFTFLFELFLIESAKLANAKVRELDADSSQKFWVNSRNPPVVVIRGQLKLSLDFVYFGDNVEAIPHDIRETLGSYLTTTHDLLESSTRQFGQIKDGARLRSILQEYFNVQQLFRILDERKYVLTPYFAYVLYYINERVKAKENVVLVGETGMGKTELLALYCDIVNAEFKFDIFYSIKQALGRVVEDRRVFQCQHLLIVENLIEQIAQNEIENCTCEAVLKSLFEEIRAKRKSFPLLKPGKNNKYIGSIFEADSWENWRPKGSSNIDSKMVIAIVREYGHCKFEELFIKIRMHREYSAEKLRSKVKTIVGRYKSVKERFAALEMPTSRCPKFIVLLDELNTSRVMGMIKSIVCDKRIDDKQLPDGIAWVCAMNPHRKSNTNSELNYNGVTSSDDQLLYMVEKIPGSMQDFVFKFESLQGDLEKVFIEQLKPQTRYLEVHDHYYSLTKMILFCQTFLRGRNIHRMSASLRDITRTVKLHNFFIEHPALLGEPKADTVLDNSRHWQSLLMAIGTNYYLRLPPLDRDIFCKLLATELANLVVKDESKRCPPTLTGKFAEIMRNTMLNLYKNTPIPDGIACTDTLLEDLWAVTVCSAAVVPLVIIGPPGCSKTLSFIIATNKKRNEKNPEFYRNIPILDPVSYQCSSQSTGTEIFKRYREALHKQSIHDEEAKARGTKIRVQCVLFLDEAGLSDDNALKILHYYMDHAHLPIILVSNAVIDAAKMNRGVQVFQCTSDSDIKRLASEILQVAFGNPLIAKLCEAYQFTTKEHSIFHLRDFIFFLKNLRTNSSFVSGKFTLNAKTFLKALEHNFNGISKEKFRKLVESWLGIVNGALRKTLQVNETDYTPTIQLIRENCDLAGRYLMLIDPSEDNTAVSLFYKWLCSPVNGCLYFNGRECVEVSIGDFELDKSDEEIILAVRSVMMAMQEGKTVVFINSHLINGCFYELFNRYFKERARVDAENDYFVSVAVGSYSNECKVHKDFRVVMYVRESQLPKMQHPFLNRFAKFLFSSQVILGDIVASKNCEILNHEGNEKSFIELVQAGGAKFTNQGNSKLLYGLASETIPSLIVEAVRPNENNTLHIRTQNLDGKKTYKQATPKDIERAKKLSKKVAHKLLNLARPEELTCSKLKKVSYFMDEYFSNQEHFSAVRLIKALLRAERRKTNKWIFYTRTFESHRLWEAKAIVESACNVSCELISLVQFRTSREMQETLHQLDKKLVIINIDMQVCQISQVTSAKRLIDIISAKKQEILFILMLHFSPILKQFCFPVSYIQNWDYVYVDALGLYSDTTADVPDAAIIKEEIDGKSWIAKGLGVQIPDTSTASKIEFYQKFICDKVISLLCAFEAASQTDLSLYSSILYKISDKQQPEGKANIQAFVNSENYLFHSFIEYFCHCCSSVQLAHVIEIASAKIASGNSQDSFIKIVVNTLNHLLDVNIRRFIELTLSNFQFEHAFYMHQCKSTNNMQERHKAKAKRWEEIYRQSILLLPPPPFSYVDLVFKKTNAAPLSVDHRFNYITRVPMFPFIHSLLTEYCKAYFSRLKKKKIEPENGLEQFYFMLKRRNMLPLVNELASGLVLPSYLKDILTKELLIPTESNTIQDKQPGRPRPFFLMKLFTGIIKKIVDDWINVQNETYKQLSSEEKSIYTLLGYYVMLSTHHTRLLFMKDFLEKFNDFTDSGQDPQQLLFDKKSISVDRLGIGDISEYFPISNESEGSSRSHEDFVTYLHEKLLVPICWMSYSNLLRNYSININVKGLNATLLWQWLSIFNYFHFRTEKSWNVFSILNHKPQEETHLLDQYSLMFAFNLFIAENQHNFVSIERILSSPLIMLLLQRETSADCELFSIFQHLTVLFSQCTNHADDNAMIWRVTSKAIRSIFSGRRIFQASVHAFDMYTKNLEFLFQLLNGDAPSEFKKIKKVWLNYYANSCHVTLLAESIINKHYSKHVLRLHDFCYKQNHFNIAEKIILAKHLQAGNNFEGNNIANYHFTLKEAMPLENILFQILCEKFEYFTQSQLMKRKHNFPHTSIINVIKSAAVSCIANKSRPFRKLTFVSMLIPNCVKEIVKRAHAVNIECDLLTITCKHASVIDLHLPFIPDLLHSFSTISQFIHRTNANWFNDSYVALMKGNFLQKAVLKQYFLELFEILANLQLPLRTNSETIGSLLHRCLFFVESVLKKLKPLFLTFYKHYRGLLAPVSDKSKPKCYNFASLSLQCTFCFNFPVSEETVSSWLERTVVWHVRELNTEVGNRIGVLSKEELERVMYGVNKNLLTFLLPLSNFVGECEQNLHFNFHFSSNTPILPGIQWRAESSVVYNSLNVQSPRPVPCPTEIQEIINLNPLQFIRDEINKKGKSHPLELRIPASCSVNEKKLGEIAARVMDLLLAAQENNKTDESISDELVQTLQTEFPTFNLPATCNTCHTICELIIALDAQKPWLFNTLGRELKTNLSISQKKQLEDFSSQVLTGTLEEKKTVLADYNQFLARLLSSGVITRVKSTKNTATKLFVLLKDAPEVFVKYVDDVTCAQFVPICQWTCNFVQILDLHVAQAEKEMSERSTEMENEMDTFENIWLPLELISHPCSSMPDIPATLEEPMKEETETWEEIDVGSKHSGSRKGAFSWLIANVELLSCCAPLFQFCKTYQTSPQAAGKERSLLCVFIELIKRCDEEKIVFRQELIDTLLHSRPFYSHFDLISEFQFSEFYANLDAECEKLLPPLPIYHCISLDAEKIDSIYQTTPSVSLVRRVSSRSLIQTPDAPKISSILAHFAASHSFLILEVKKKTPGFLVETKVQLNKYQARLVAFVRKVQENHFEYVLVDSCPNVESLLQNGILFLFQFVEKHETFFK